jgi:hypothetical protein
LNVSESANVSERGLKLVKRAGAYHGWNLCWRSSGNFSLDRRHPVRKRGLPGGPPEACFEGLAMAGRPAECSAWFYGSSNRHCCACISQLKQWPSRLRLLTSYVTWVANSPHSGHRGSVGIMINPSCSVKLFLIRFIRYFSSLIVISVIPSGDVYLVTGGSQGRRCGKRFHRFP